MVGSILSRLLRLIQRIIRALTLRLWATAELAIARRSSRRRLERVAARRVLVVCYGNIYRSAFVGALLKTRLPPSIQVRSAGFHQVADRPSPERHVEQCKAYGVSLERHRSAVIAPDDLEWADLILLMDRRNWAALRQMGASRRKIVWLGAWSPGPLEIADPYRMSDEDAWRVVQRLNDSTEALVAALLTVR